MEVFPWGANINLFRDPRKLDIDYCRSCPIYYPDYVDSHVNKSLPFVDVVPMTCSIPSFVVNEIDIKKINLKYFG